MNACMIFHYCKSCKFHDLGLMNVENTEKNKKFQRTKVDMPDLIEYATLMETLKKLPQDTQALT